MTAAYLIFGLDGVPTLLLLPPCFPFCLLNDSAAKEGYRHLQMLRQMAYGRPSEIELGL